MVTAHGICAVVCTQNFFDNFHAPHMEKEFLCADHWIFLCKFFTVLHVLENLTTHPWFACLCVGAPPILKMGWTSSIPGLVTRMGMSVIAGQVGRMGPNLPVHLHMSVQHPAWETLWILIGVVGLGGFRCSPMSNHCEQSTCSLCGLVAKSRFRHWKPGLGPLWKICAEKFSGLHMEIVKEILCAVTIEFHST